MKPLMLLLATLMLSGCAYLKAGESQLPPAPPKPVSSVQLPELQKLPQSVMEPSFLQRLETSLTKLKEQTQ